MFRIISNVLCALTITMVAVNQAEASSPVDQRLQGINIGRPIHVATLCHSDELVEFSCILKNKKMVSICASPDAASGLGYVQYRFGPSPSSVEFEYPKKRVPPEGYFKMASQGANDGYAWGMSFWSGSYRYSVFETEVDWKTVAGVVVDRNQKILSFDQCVDSTIAHTVLPDNKPVLPKLPDAGDDISFLQLENMGVLGWHGVKSITIGAAKNNSTDK